VPRPGRRRDGEPKLGSARHRSQLINHVGVARARIGNADAQRAVLIEGGHLGNDLDDLPARLDDLDRLGAHPHNGIAEWPGLAQPIDPPGQQLRLGQVPEHGMRIGRHSRGQHLLVHQYRPVRS
jgi:hypothetical protein